ncbi:hypothetical protein O181_035145 [Austropuccinia psidii MF-1]|uniref:Uncharacterized protein n=1 Tax=Austropuccinia psidii MF-1 TaxID=1389203 RepID=A0A9Q3HAX2_9BASI|nr:hypothetical protein [Austropuccinia psidii MF-1]
MTSPVSGQGRSNEESTQVVFLKKKKKSSGNVRLKNSITESVAQLNESEQDQENDSGPTIEEIIALRKLKQAKVGIELNKLNAGEPKKKKKKRNSKSLITGESNDSEGLLQPHADDLKKDDRMDEDEPEDDDARTRKIIKSNNFTQQTNTLDVDKHMMLYIEQELQNRRKAAIAAGADEASEPILKGAEAVASLDPRDELYKIAEKYRIDKKPVVEGNVTLSATMLTSIPEVDLGIDTRIKNIEATEKAKRQLSEQRSQNGLHSSIKNSPPSMDTKEHFAADRFMLPNHLKHSAAPDLDSLKVARLEKEGLHEEAEALKKELKRKAYQLKYGNNHQAGGGLGHRHYGVKFNQVATDDRAVENFRKRMAGRR